MRASSTSDDLTLFLTTASALLGTEDAKGGMKAFAKKQKPRFEGALKGGSFPGDGLGGEKAEDQGDGQPAHVARGGAPG